MSKHMKIKMNRQEKIICATTYLFFISVGIIVGGLILVQGIHNAVNMGDYTVAFLQSLLVCVQFLYFAVLGFIIDGAIRNKMRKRTMDKQLKLMKLMRKESSKDRDCGGKK